MAAAMSWTERARAKIAEIHAMLPADASFSARKAALRNQYPFGERSYWPYRAWLKARREYLSKYDPKRPTARQLLAARDDIIFPFAADGQP